MAGYVPGQMPASFAEEKQFVQAYEDVLERCTEQFYFVFCNETCFLPREKGRMRFHRLQNVQIALDFLKQRQVKLVNIRNDDITDGNPKLTLGLIWTIILHFQVMMQHLVGSGEGAKKVVLNFTKTLLNVLYRPDLIDMEKVAVQSNYENLEQAFAVAEQLGVTRLLDPEDVDVPSPDEKSVITYVSSIYDAFPKIPEGGEGISANEVDSKWQEYQNKVIYLFQWIRQHITMMSDKTFPHNPVELKALYNEYVHFKETEIPAKEAEKSQIQHLYKLFEVWMEFGRIKLPQGYHPNDVEEEWGKLIVEMLEREKALRPAVERLELLLQIANKIQNGALNCEEKLTLARNTLQADAAHLDSDQQVQYEADVAMYLQECEGLIRQLQIDVKILRDEKYYQVEQIIMRVIKLQDELVALRLECTNLYRKGHFISSTEQTGLRPLNLTVNDLTTDVGSGTLHTTSLTWFKKPMTRSELVAISSTQDEGNLRFVYELLAWVEEVQVRLERAEWGSDLPSVEAQLDIHKMIHTAVEELESGLKEAKHYEVISPNFKTSYSDTLNKLGIQYIKLLETSRLRMQHLTSLHSFVSKATTELIWLNEKEEEELAYDWSDRNTNISAKKEYFVELMKELEQKQKVIKSHQETGEQLSLENHPARQTVEAYSAALQTQWHWIKQLCCCVEQHLKENTSYFQFLSDVKEADLYLRNLQETIKRKYKCDRTSGLSKLEDLLQDSMDEKEQLIQYKSSIASLVGRAKTIVQLIPRNPDNALKTTIPIKAICDYRQIEITVCKNDECVLEDNSHRTKWKVISPTGNEAMVPSVCFIIPAPNQEAIDMGARVEQMYQNVMALWHQLHVNMKSVVSWNYLVKDIEIVCSWNKENVRTRFLYLFEQQQVMKKLHMHYADFLVDSQESQVFSIADRLRLEEEVDNCKERCEQLLVATEAKDETLSKTYISDLQNVTLRLEKCEDRLIRRLQAPLEGDPVQDSALRIAEQEETQKELDELKSNLNELTKKCEGFFYQSPSAASVPMLRSEMDVVIEKMSQVSALSSSYTEKLKTVDVVLKNSQSAETLVKMYEMKLSEEDLIPADQKAIEAHRNILQQWCEEVEGNRGVFSSLEKDIQQANAACEHLGHLHHDRSLDLERYREKVEQLKDRWRHVCSQIETRQSELESIQEVLEDYRGCHQSLIQWIEETTLQQEKMEPGKAEDRKILSEQLSQETALVAEIEKNQAKLDECQDLSKQYSSSVKDYELQLMTYRACVESHQKSAIKRWRIHSSSDVITQEFMDLRTRYTALVTLTTQHVKYISDALRRLEEEEVCFLTWCDLIEDSSLRRMSEEEREQVTSQLNDLKETYNQLCDQSAEQVQQIQNQLTQEVQRKDNETIAGVIDLGTVEIFPIFHAMQRGLIDQDTGLALLQIQVTVCGLTIPETNERLSVEEAFQKGAIDDRTYRPLQELETALKVIERTSFANTQLLPTAAAIDEKVIEENVGLKILEAQLSSGGLSIPSTGEAISLEKAFQQGLINAPLHSKLLARTKMQKDLIDPNTAEKLTLSELMQRCIVDKETGLTLFPIKQLAGGMVGLTSGKKVSIFRAIQEGLIDQQVMVRLLEAQLFAGGIVDPRTGHRLTVDEAVRHNLIDHDIACAILIRQIQMGGVIDPVSGQRLALDEAVQRDLMTSRSALVVLESLWSFQGLLWPESGEVLPMVNALQQGIVSTELAHRILKKRATVAALYIPETLEVISWGKSVQEGILDKNVADLLTSIQIPDAIPNLQEPGTSSMNRLSWNSACGRLTYSSLQFVNTNSSTETSDSGAMEERLLSHLMTHSYMNVHNGNRTLLVDAELNDMTKGLIEARENAAVMSREDLIRACNGKLLQQGHLNVTENVPANIPDVKNCHVLDVNMVEPILVDVKDGIKQENSNWTLKGKGERLPCVEQTTEGTVTEVSSTDQILVLSSVLNDDYLDEESALDILTAQLQTGGITDERTGEKLTLNNAMTKGILQSHTALKLMEKLGILSGFFDPQTCETLTVSEAVDEGLMDEELIQKVFNSEKVICGVIDQGQSSVLSVKDAVEIGLLDHETAARILEGQVVSGGIIDLKRGKRLSVTLASKMGLVEDRHLDNLTKLEKATKGKESDESTKLKMMMLQMEMNGIVDPQTKELLTVVEARERGVLDKETILKALKKQVVDGGIIDHSSGMRLSVTDAGEYGLIDQDIATELIEVERACQHKYVHPKMMQPVTLSEAASLGLVNSAFAAEIQALQALSGTFTEPTTGKKLTLTQASKQGMLEKSVLEKAMSSPELNQGIVDPERCAIIPYSELIKKGKIDLDSGQRYMETTYFTGIKDELTGETLSVAEAVKAAKVDPVPALRLLQAQADSGGILDNTIGDRYNKQQCLEHDENLVTYLSLVLDVEVRLKQHLPVSTSLPVLKDQLILAEVSALFELKELSNPINHELEAVVQVLEGSTQNVPQQLLKALEKDSKNLQKSFTSVCEVSRAWNAALTNALDTEKVINTECEQLQKTLERLVDWVTQTAQSVHQMESETSKEGIILKRYQQQYEELKEPLSLTKSDMDAAAFDVQYFISEHAQDLTPQQSRQLLRMLNELQKSFREISETILLQTEALDVHLRDKESVESKKVLKGEIQSRAGAVEELIAAQEQFLEANRDKLDPKEAAELESKLLSAKGQHQLLCKRAENLQKHMDTSLTAATQQQTEKVRNRTETVSTTCPCVQDDLLPIHDLVGHCCAQIGRCVSPTKHTVARHEELLSQQQAFILATQSAQSFLDKHSHNLSHEEKERLQRNLNELKARYETSLAQSEAQLKQIQSLQDEFQKFLKDHGEFEAWLVQSEQDLEEMKIGQMDTNSLQRTLQRQKSFSDDVISHKGDLRYITISGQKVLDTARSFTETSTNEDFKSAVDPSITSTLVKCKLNDAKNRYNTLHSKCNKLGTHLTNMLEKYQHFQEVANGLTSWLQRSETTAGKLVSETISSDSQSLQKQLENIKVNSLSFRNYLTEHQDSVTKLQKAAEVLLSLDDDLVPNQDQIQKITESVSQRYDALSKIVSERNEKVQISVAQSQSVQQGLDNLLEWLENVERSSKTKDSISASSTAIQDALTQNSKLKQDIAGHQSSINTIQKMVSGFIKTADKATASSLQKKLDELNSRLGTVCSNQQQNEGKLANLLPKVEQYEKLLEEVGQFVGSKSQSLAAGGDPSKDIAHFTQEIQDVSREMVKQSGALQTLEQLAEELTASSLLTHKEQLTEAALSCQQRLSEFRSLVVLMKKWLKEAESKVPAFESTLNSDTLEKQIQQIKNLLEDWSSKSSQVQDISHQGTELENLIMEITSPNSALISSKSGNAGSGFCGCSKLSEIQCSVSDVNSGYESLGNVLRERRDHLGSTLDQMQQVQEETNSIMKWLEVKEQTLSTLNSSPAKPQSVKAQAEQNKALLDELDQHCSKVEKLKQALTNLIKKNPESPEAEKCRKMLQEMESKWNRTRQTIAEKQQKLEESANLLTSFQSTESQLSPWLTEKELMMSVLGPLSIDPNMLHAQKQQVQFMLKEFETRKPQYEQLNQAAHGILNGPEDVSPLDDQVRDQQRAITEKWDKLTSQLGGRSHQIDQAIVKSVQYQNVLQILTDKVKSLQDKLNSQPLISTQPDIVKQQLEDTSEIRSDLEQQKEQIEEAQSLCSDLSCLIGEQYLKDELRKRLDNVLLPFKSLEESAGDRMNQLQTTLASSQQFQQTFDELKSWLDGKGSEQAQKPPVSAKLDILQSQIREQEEFQKNLNQHTGSYEMIIAEGESLFLNAQPGEEKSTLQSQLVSLKAQWDELNNQATGRHSKLKDCLQKAQKYRKHIGDLLPWIEECEAKIKELEISIDPVELNSSLAKAKHLNHDVDKRHSLLEMVNQAADSLVDSCQVDEEGIRDEKADINQRMDLITEQLQAKNESIEEMAQRLKEFQDSLLNIQKKLDGAKQQLEVYDALGTQAHSNKNLEKLRVQQETLQTLEPQVDYLRDLTRGLVEDTPAGADSSQLLQQAEAVQQEYATVKQRVGESCQSMENRLQGIGQFQSHIREMYSQLADLDDELDSMSPIGRDLDSLQSQFDDVKQFMSKLKELKGDIESSQKECTHMLEEEGSPDLQGLKRELGTLNKQCGKLLERGKNRQEHVETTMDRVDDFYGRLKDLGSLLTKAEEGEELQGVVGTEVDVINQQLADFKTFQKIQVDPIQSKLQQANGMGQGLIQSATKNANTQGLEHDLDETNIRWNTLNKKVAERTSQLQEALLHRGKFQDALEPLLSWLTDTEDLIANQKPPSAEYKVVKAQIQEQKLLQRLLDDRRATVQIIKAEGERIAESAEVAEKEKIQNQLQRLGKRWDALLSKAAARQNQLEDILVIAKQFHETVEPLNEWLTSRDKKLANSEPVGTQTAKIQQQITRHKALNDDIISRKKNVDQAIKNGQALLKQTTGEEVIIIQEKLDGIKTRYAEITSASSRVLKTLEQVLQLATKFQSFNEELCTWLDSVEGELAANSPQSPVGEQIPQVHQRQKELKKEVMEYRLILDTVNEVSNALLELVPWRAREGLDRQVADANERYKTVSDTVTRRVEAIDAAIQRSQQYEQATDSELTWVAETKRKLTALGPIRLEQDQTTAQLQVQKAFSIDIIRHKDSIDELINTQEEILSTCGDEQKTMLQDKMGSLLQQYEAVSQMNTERYSQLERAQVLINQFWETYEELCPWIDETRALMSQLPPPAVDHEILKQQQEEMRQLRESISEHKPHIDKLMKIGPQLKALNPDEGKMVEEKYTTSEALYAQIKQDARQRALMLDEAISRSAQFHDKIDPMLESLEHISDRLRSPPSIPAEVDKIREHINENKNIGMELEKLQPSFDALKCCGEELIGRSTGADKDPAAKAIQDKLNQMVFFWDDIKAHAEERDIKLLDVLDLAEKFWYDMAALLTTIKDTQDIVRDLENPGIDPSIIKQQQEAAETIKEETDGLHEELEFVRILGADLIFACGELEKPEVKKSIDELNSSWDNLNKTWKERLGKLEEAMQAGVQYQDALQAMFDWLDNTVIKLSEMSPIGTDLNTVKQQINEMKQFKMEVYQQQIEMEKLNHQGELLLKKASDDTDRDVVREPLTELKHLWDDLGEKIVHRQHKLEGALLALGQFQHALAELMSWLNYTEDLLDGQRPISGDPKAIEIELAKHHVLKNDVLAHTSTVETVNKAGNELLESSEGEDANNLKSRLDKLNQSWQSVLHKTEGREQQLEAALQQAEGFHSEIEEFLQWLSRIENQLAASKSTGGLPETAREQLNAHLDLYSEFCANEETYRKLHEKGQLLLYSRDDTAGSNAEQCVTLLAQKWQAIGVKMVERKTKLEEALNLATEFQNSLQDFINWLTQAEQGLNVAAPPSLILDTVLFQIDEHKIFANEVNLHRDQIIDLDKTGNQLKFLSQKQDVVLIKNLLFSVQSRWEKVVQRSVERGRGLDDARKRAKQFYEAWKKLIDWLEEAENNLDSDLEISNDPDKIKLQLVKHKEFQKTLGGKQPVYDTTIRMGRSMKDKASLQDDRQKLDNLLGEVRDKWDTVCGKSVERQHKLEEALLFSGQFTDALQALVDWLYKVEPQLAEDQPVHGDLDLVMNLLDAHKVFQKELGKRTSSVQVLKRSARELIENSRDDTTWVKVQLQELSTRWDTVCKLSVSKQTRLEQALKQAEEFRNAVHALLEWLSEAEQTLRFRGVLPDDVEALQSLIDLHKDFMKKVEEKRVDVNQAAEMGEAILAVCHPDCVTTVKHWITIIRARFEEVLTWAKQHHQRLATALSELVTNAELLDELLTWLQWAETTLIQRDQDPMAKDIEQVKTLIAEHQSFMEEMTRKQPDVDKVTKTYKRKAVEPSHMRGRKPLHQLANPPSPVTVPSQTEAKNPRINLLSGRWQQVWLLALERQRKLHDCLDRLEELKEFANFDFDVWRKKYMRWMNHKKSRVMDFFRRIDKDQDGKITRQEFIDGILSSKFPTSKLEMTAVADIFDRDGDGYIDYYEFVAALHPNKDAYRPVTDADKIEDEVTRQVAQCKCAKRFQVEQIGENKYRSRLFCLQFGDSQQLRLVRILRSTVMVRVGGGWMALDEFLVKNDPCRGKTDSSGAICIHSATTTATTTCTCT
uniref:Microtubule actin crosslinking factor 1 n=1 Tax=Callorhinchus milii TaxID=7868 RepID=A0A4W3HHY9_CALMI